MLDFFKYKILICIYFGVYVMSNFDKLRTHIIFVETSRKLFVGALSLCAIFALFTMGLHYVRQASHPAYASKSNPPPKAHIKSTSKPTQQKDQQATSKPNQQKGQKATSKPNQAPPTTTPTSKPTLSFEDNFQNTIKALMAGDSQVPVDDCVVAAQKSKDKRQALFSNIEDCPETVGKVGRMMPAEAMSLYQQKKVLFIDARAVAQYRAEHIKDAINIAYNPISPVTKARVAQLKQRASYIVVYDALSLKEWVCQNRAMKPSEGLKTLKQADCEPPRDIASFIAEEILNGGFHNTHILIGGLEGWKKAGGMVRRLVTKNVP
jgi:rhodanese-related sulfurtransferase